jgi:hypothetical protein
MHPANTFAPGEAKHAVLKKEADNLAPPRPWPVRESQPVTLDKPS